MLVLVFDVPWLVPPWIAADLVKVLIWACSISSLSASSVTALVPFDVVANAISLVGGFDISRLASLQMISKRSFNIFAIA